MSAYGTQVDSTTGGDLAENAIMWIILTSDAAEGSDKLTKREETPEPFSKAAEAIILLVSAYDKLDKRGLSSLRKSSPTRTRLSYWSVPMATRSKAPSLDSHASSEAVHDLRVRRIPRIYAVFAMRSIVSYDAKMIVSQDERQC